MSLNGIISKDLAEKLADLSVDDFVALTKAGSLGFNPWSLHTAVQGIARDEDVALPEPNLGPHPLVVQAWSFVKDHGQYHDTYGLSSSKAGELLDLLKTDADKGVAEIQRIVTEALRRKGSNRAVTVNRNGMPGGAFQGGVSGGAKTSGILALKEEIRRSPATYGLYSFAAEDTGRSGDLHFRVRLGGGFFACFSSKRGAIDVARIARVKGRLEPLIANHVAFWPHGSAPRFGADIPKEATFTCVLGPGEKAPGDPVRAARTTAPGE